MAKRLSTQLRTHGCDMDPAQFKRVVAETKQQMYPTLSEEEVVCLDESETYCDEVRRRVGVELPRPFIRFQLLNSHK